MIYGYARVSTATQSIDRQVRNIIKEYPKAKIYQEAYSGRSSSRPELDKLKKLVKSGDTIVFDSVSRMSRNAQEGFIQYQEWFQQGINLIFIKEPHINTDTYKQALDSKISLTGDDVDLILQGVNEYLLTLAKKQIKIAFDQSEKEVSDLRQRTKEGILTAKLNGKQIGAVKGSTFETKKSVAAKKIIMQHSITFGGSLTDKEVMQLANISNNTFYKYKNELKAE